MFNRSRRAVSEETAMDEEDKAMEEEEESMDDKDAKYEEKSEDDMEEDEAEKPTEAMDDENEKEAAEEDKEMSARVSERKRISAILNSDEAKGRGKLAKHFAFNTTMSLKDARAALDAAPKSSGLDQKMSGNATAGLGTAEKSAESIADKRRARAASRKQ